MTEYYIFTCLHCNEPFIIYSNELNCRILRHGAYRDTLKPIEPHASKSVCDELAKNYKIIGCGKPLQIVGDEPNLKIIVCDYI